LRVQAPLIERASDLDVGIFVQKSIDLRHDVRVRPAQGPDGRGSWRSERARGAAAEADMHYQLCPFEERHILDDQSQHPFPLTGGGRRVTPQPWDILCKGQDTLALLRREGCTIGIVLLTVPVLGVGELP